jgi:predicted nucleic acid-binding protein
LGDLGQDLAGHSAIGVDTSPFIYLWECHPRYQALASELFEHLKRPGVQGVTSIITLIESCVHPRRNGRYDLVQAYENALLHSRQVRTMPVDAVLARRAVDLRASYGIRVPDALQIAASLEAGATAFVTNDKRLARVQEIQVLVIGDYAV